MATTILDTSFDAGLDEWEANEGAALDGAGGITFAAATAPNAFISRAVEYTGGEAYITFRITFSASAADNFYLSVWDGGGVAIAAFIGGEVAICGQEAVDQLFGSVPPALPAGAAPVTLLAGQNDASLVFTSGGAMLFLNGAQVTPLLPGVTTSSFEYAMLDTGTLTVPSSFVIDSAALLATDALPTPPEEEPPEEEPPPVSVALPAGLDTSWEAAQEAAQETPGVGWSIFEGFAAGAEAPTNSAPVESQVGTSGATWSAIIESHEF